MVQKNNKVALVTGAGRRIGAVIAQYLHESGMNVIVHYNNSESEAKKLVESACQKRANSMICIKADLNDNQQLQQLADQAKAQWGRVDLLVNNAATFYPTEIGQVNEKAWEGLFSCNVQAPFFLSQALTPALKQVRGNIINITDIHAQIPLKNYNVYCMTKAALNMMTESLARDLAPNVRVNAIAIGVTFWPEGDDNLLSAQEQQKVLDRIPLEKIGDPQLIAETILFISEKAHYMTGDIIMLDGGRHLKN